MNALILALLRARGNGCAFRLFSDVGFLLALSVIGDSCRRLSLSASLGKARGLDFKYRPLLPATFPSSSTNTHLQTTSLDHDSINQINNSNHTNHTDTAIMQIFVKTRK